MPSLELFFGFGEVGALVAFEGENVALAAFELGVLSANRLVELFVSLLVHCGDLGGLLVLRSGRVFFEFDACGELGVGP